MPPAVQSLYSLLSVAALDIGHGCLGPDDRYTSRAWSGFKLAVGMFAPVAAILSALILGNKLLSSFPKFGAKSGRSAEYWQRRLRTVGLIWAALVSFVCVRLSVGLLHCVPYGGERSVLAEDTAQFCFSEVPAATAAEFKFGSVDLSKAWHRTMWAVHGYAATCLVLMGAALPLYVAVKARTAAARTAWLDAARRLELGFFYEGWRPSAVGFFAAGQLLLLSLPATLAVLLDDIIYSYGPI